MGHDKRPKEIGRGRVPRSPERQSFVAPTQQGRNDARRQQYAVDPGYADRQRQAARQSYRKEHPVVRKLENGLLAQGTLREVTAPDMEYPQVVEAFTLPEAARALGRTELTLKRWIEDDLIPEPILRDTSRGHRQYSVGELRILATQLQEHELESAYYARTHTARREQVMQHMFAFRQHHV